MKTRLQTSLGQQLVLTPQLQQAIKLLQMSATELELEIAQAVESNPLLDWADSNDSNAANEGSDGNDNEAPAERSDDGDDWAPTELDWTTTGSGGSFDDDDDNGSAAERVAETETLADHLLWQLHLSHLSSRDRSIGAALIDALDDDGYLREPLATIAETLLPAIHADEDGSSPCCTASSASIRWVWLHARWANACCCSWMCWPATRPACSWRDRLPRDPGTFAAQRRHRARP